jgi:hypothetical protein
MVVNFTVCAWVWVQENFYQLRLSVQSPSFAENPVSFFDKIREKSVHIVTVQADCSVVARKRWKCYSLHIFLHIYASKQLITSLRRNKWAKERRIKPVRNLCSYSLYFLGSCVKEANPDSRALWGVGLKLLDCWNGPFEFRWGYGCASSVSVLCFVGSGLCDGLVFLSQESGHNIHALLHSLLCQSSDYSRSKLRVF